MFIKLNVIHMASLIGALFIVFSFLGKLGASQNEGIELEVVYESFIPVNMKKYGVNGALLGSKMSYGNNLLVDAYKDIGLAFTRFPGGTIGNYYNWGSGGFSCNIAPNEKSAKRIQRMNRTLKRTGGSYSVDDFFHFVSATGTEYTYMLNILCDSAENNSKLLQFMKKNNVDLKYIEMGNEIYSNNYTWIYKDADSYIKGVEENYSAVKDMYPDAKVGLVVSPISYSGNARPEPNGKPSKSWPKRLRDYDVLSANSMFSDALVIHVYGHPYNNKWLKADPVTFEEHYLTVIEHFNDKFDMSMQYLQELGNNKPVWVTEWGVSAPINKRKGVFREYKKSAFHALYVASALLSITLNENVEVANYHIIRDLWVPVKDGYEITPVGKVINMFIDSARHSKTAYNVSINSDTTGIKALMHSTDTGEELLLVNESNKNYIINKLKTKNKYSNYKVESMSIISDEFKVDSNIYNNNLDSKGIVIEPYSILRISKANSNKVN